MSGRVLAHSTITREDEIPPEHHCYRYINIFFSNFHITTPFSHYSAVGYNKMVANFLKHCLGENGGI